MPRLSRKRKLMEDMIVYVVLVTARHYTTVGEEYKITYNEGVYRTFARADAVAKKLCKSNTEAFVEEHTVEG